MIHHGDCLAIMPTLAAESIDAIVTDPPYDLLSASRNGSRRTPPVDAAGNPFARHDRGGAAGGFMGKAWDGTGVAFRPETWAAALRVAKPGAYLLSFGGTRTVHRMTCAIEDAGWIIRDMLVWGYASGFPKGRANLKPAWEPIVMARKPGPLRMLAIDECRIPGTDGDGHWSGDDGSDATSRPGFDGGFTKGGKADRHGGGAVASTVGRWPANVLLTDAIFDGDVPGVVGGGEQSGGGNPRWRSAEALDGSYHGNFAGGETGLRPFDTSGTYSRFFLIPKAARSDREPVLGGQIEARETLIGAEGHKMNPMTGLPVVDIPRENVHPTVKPVDLMRHLVRLVTPPGGTVLDPFLGSGTTALAAELEGFAWVGIEREEEYVRIAEARLNGTQRGMAL